MTDTKKAPITKVLVCGTRCTGKTTLLWGLQRKTGWPTFSASGYLRDFIRGRGIGGKKQEIEKHHTNISKEIDGRIAALLNSDHKVIVEARAFGGIKDKWPGVIRLLLTAEDTVRNKRSAEREGIQYARAAKRLEKRDNEFITNTGKIVGFFDLFNPDYYDVVIDTSKMTPEQVVDETMQAVRGSV